jgi:hypothetical protein
MLWPVSRPCHLCIPAALILLFHLRRAASFPSRLTQKPHEPVLHFRAPSTSRLAFPNRKHLPTQPAQRPSSSAIPIGIPLNLRNPVIAPRGGDAARPTAMHVPEAAVDEDDFFESWENEVGCAGEGGDVESVAEAERVDDAADSNFGRVARERRFPAALPPQYLG